MSLSMVIILYTVRAVTSAFTPNDMKKNAVTAERYQSGKGRLSATTLIWKPRVVNAVTMMDARLVYRLVDCCRLAPKNASDKRHGITITNGCQWRHMIQHR